jgi:hypothetical protein
MTTTKSWGGRMAAVAAAVGLLVSATGAVQAQPNDGVDVAFNIAPGGTLSVPGLDDNFEIPVPDPNPPQLQGVWSPTTGDFVGNLSGEKFTVQVNDPITITLEVTFGSTGVSGTIPADGTPGSVSVSGFTYTARDVAEPSLVNCTLQGADVEVTATLVPGEPLVLELVGDLVLSLSPLPDGCALLETLLPPGTPSLAVGLDLRLAQVAAPAPTPAVAKPAFTG